jgi:hypothetical protein
MFVPCINSIKALFIIPTDARSYKITGILKQLKFRLSLRHVSVHAGTIIREPFLYLAGSLHSSASESPKFRAPTKIEVKLLLSTSQIPFSTVHRTPAQQVGMLP